MESIPSRVETRPARPADESEVQKNKVGYTNQNLHRYIEEDSTSKVTLGIYDSIHSYRTVDSSEHDEESETSEIP